MTVQKNVLRAVMAAGVVAASTCGSEVDEAKFRRIVREELGKEAVRLRKAKAQPRPSPAGPIASPTGFPGIRKTGPYRYEVDRSAKDRISTQAGMHTRIVPAVRNGKTVGFKLFSIRPKSTVAGLGFKNGDVVRSVNGIDITSADMALKAYTVVRIASTITIRIDRRGKPLTLTYVVK
jgi:general secretion pathway protein C